MRINKQCTEAYKATPWEKEASIDQAASPMKGEKEYEPSAASETKSITRSDKHAKLAARIFRSIESIEAAEIWKADTTEGRTAMLSGGGAGSGST